MIARLLAALALALVPLSVLHAAPATVDLRFDAMAAAARAKMLTDPAGALADTERAGDYAVKRGAGASRDLMIATASWLRGEAYTRTGRNDLARPLLETAVEEARRLAPRGRLLADALLSRGSLRAGEGQVARAMTDLHEAHDVFQGLGESRGRARAFVQIANLYCDANDWSAGLRYFQQALDIYDADPGLAVGIYNGQGLALLKLERIEDASVTFARALEAARDLKSPAMIAVTLRNLARARLMNGRASAARTAILDSMALTAGSASPDVVRRERGLLAQAFLQQRDLVKAERMVNQAFADVDLRRTELADRDAHQTAYDIYRALGRDDLALAHLTALKRLDDEATELARSNGAALMAARFDFANQEVRIANLKADDLLKSVAYERARAKTQKSVLLGGVGTTLLVIAMLAYALIAVRRSRDRVRAANVTLESTNTALGKALAAKTEFLATTSHEIRTPLNGILGMTQVMLADPRVDAATRDRVSVVHGAGVTMRALVDDILDVAKMETGNLTIEDGAFDLKASLTESTRMWDEQAQAKGLAFSVDLRDCPAAIRGDAGRLRQIVFNLLSNALKFTPSGSVTLRASRLGDRYEVAVCDTGIGIAPGRHEQIFESFQQADTSMTRQYGGTGLGLTICRNLARAMAGDVTVASEEGHGATFTLTLPLHEVAEMAGEAAEPTFIGVLVIDASPITRAKLKSVLQPSLGRVEAVADVRSALALLAASSCGVVLADDGALGDNEAAPDMLRALAETAGAARVVVLRRTAGPDRSALLSAGAVLVLDRPIAREALIAALAGETGTVETPVAAQAA